MKRKWIGLGVVFLLCGAMPVAYAAADQLTVIIHGKTVSSNEPIKVVEGKTLVPMRVIAEHLGQEVHWDSSSNTVTVIEKPTVRVSKLSIQRQTDIFQTQDIGEAEQALITNLNTLYHAAYRGLLADLENGSYLLTSDEIDFLQANEKEGVEQPSDHPIHARFFQPAYIPEEGENAPAVKDLLFFVNKKEPDALLIGAQNPNNLNEWRMLKVQDYGKWFEKEIDLYIRATSGL